MIGRALVALGVTTFGLVGVAPAVGGSPVLSEAGSVALAVLGEPSRPSALADSTLESLGLYLAATDCAGVRTAYQDPDAPVPAGSTVTVDAVGTVQITSPFSTSAVLGYDKGASCEYEVATEPTLQLSGGAAPTISVFVAVQCVSLLGLTVFAAETAIDGAPRTVFASPDGDAGGPDDWKLVVADVTLADAIAGKGVKTPRLAVAAKGVVADGAVELTAPTGETLHMACTPTAPLTKDG